jgi:hypothetical protein
MLTEYKEKEDMITERSDNENQNNNMVSHSDDEKIFNQFLESIE